MRYKEVVKKISVPAENKIKQKQYIENGRLPVIDQGSKLIGGYSDDEEKIVKCNLPVIVFGDHTKCVKYVNFPFCAGADGIKVLKPNDDCSEKYLYYLTKYVALKIKDHGYARHYQYVEKEEVYIPSLNEQARIVSRIEELFSELDKGVETLQIIKEQLAVYRQAVLKRAFEGKFTEQWRSEHSEIENSFKTLLDSILSDGHKEKYESEKNIKLSKLPNLWKWIRIGDISNGPEYGTSKKSEKEGKIPVIRMGNLQKGIIDWEDLVYTSDDDEIIKYQLKAGDVLFNRTNSPELVGKTSIYRGEREAVFAGYLIRINQADFIDSEYLTYYMNSFTAKQYGNNVKTDGVNQSNINGKKLCSYPFPLCSVEEQKQVVYELGFRLTVCDNIDKMVDTTLAQAEAMRQSILKKAFEGGLN